MLNAIIDLSLKNRFVVLLLAGLLVVIGIRSAMRLPLDAFPDTTPVQVQINTVAPELSPEEVERLITFPVEYAMGGLKGLEELRSVSKFGFSQVVAIFEDGTDIYFARQQINERLGEAELPEGIARPEDGPGRDRPGRGLPLPPHEREPRLRPDRSFARSRIGSSGRGSAACRASPKSTPGAATRSSSRSQADPAKLAKHGLTLDDVDAGPPAEQPERRRRLRGPLGRGEPRPGRGAGRRPSSRSTTSSSRRTTGCRSASGTWPRSRSATPSAGAA